MQLGVNVYIQENIINNTRQKMLGIELEVQSILIEFRQYNFEVRWSASRILDLEG